ncbi:MAG: tRNA (adenosine(37)-N6)-dimethylallyltransferase MiaA [Flavobacteriales bacterium]|nr:tRNA (adenosine(37)-N6)-dimethylallyltransferase MiaA [Flavobacteriales bacterium]
MPLKTLIVLLGPTGIGKTELSLKIADYFRTEIISSDSRQMFREISIGTAKPTSTQLAAAPHHFINSKSIHDSYTVSDYENDAIALIEKLYKTHNTLILSGGSGLYIDAICKGFDPTPTPNKELRKDLEQELSDLGIESLQNKIKKLDPKLYETIDLQNPTRLIRAIEVCIITGKPFSDLLIKQGKKRNFNVIKIGLKMEREDLYIRINLRVDEMMKEGMLNEAKAIFAHRHSNALKAIGYAPLFDFLENKTDLKFAVDKIKQHHRNFAKRQITWFKRDATINWFNRDEHEQIIQFIAQRVS